MEINKEVEMDISAAAAMKSMEKATGTGSGRDAKKEMIKNAVEKANINRTKKVSIIEGSAFSVSDGVGLRYITPYALAMGANNTHIGILSSLPTLFGNFSQLFSIKAMNRINRRNICLYSALFQALMWLPIILLGMMFFVFHIDSGTTPALLILVYTLLIIGGAFYGPAWNSWMKDIVQKESGKYFGIRSRICGAVALISMLIAGFVLDYFKIINIFLGFAILFFIAFLARAVSAFFFTKKYEPEFKPEKEYYFNFRQFLGKMPNNNFGRFVIFVSLMTFAIAIGSPFFAVYMLKNLQFSYVDYILITMASSFAILIFIPAWGKFADVYGNMKVLQICCSVMFLVPLLWLGSVFVLASSPWLIIPYLIVVELFSGFALAGFNLSSSNFIYDAVTRQRMALCVAYFNILNSIGGFVGAMLGGFISSLSFTVIGLSSILFIFLLSGVMRFGVYALMISRIKEVKKVRDFGLGETREILLSMSPRKLIGILR